MAISFRAITDAEFPAFHAAAEFAFGDARRPQAVEHERGVFEPARSIAAFDGTSIVGTAGAFSLTMGVPGGDAAVAGVSWVSVTPTHRRRGLLTEMMTRQLRDIRDRGEESVAALFASEAAIYPRFGYGLAALSGHVSLDTRQSAFHPLPAPGGTVTVLAPEEAQPVIAPAYDAARRLRPGLLARNDAWWTARLADLDHWRGDGSVLRVAAYADGDRCTGYAMYRTHQSWQDTGPNGTVEVRELIAAEPDAEAALWRYLLDLDLMRLLTMPNLPPDSALLHLLLEPRAARLRLADNLWVRVIDVPAALRQRHYATPGTVVLEVEDALCPWNPGRYELAAAAEGVTCERTTRAADIALSAAELGAVYLGGTRLLTLARAGRVRELTTGAVRRADRMFGWSPLPCCPQVF